MARPGKKKAAKKKKAKARSGRGLFLAGLLLTLAASLALAVFLVFFHRPAQEPAPRPERTLPQLSAPAKKRAAAPSEQPAAPTADPAVAVPAPAPGRPLVAIVIDDMGYQAETGRGLLALDLPLTFAFLPHAPANPALLAEAEDRDREILLHLPMESTDPEKHPGPGALFTSMNAAAMRGELQRNLRDIPQAVGVNNHMGSRFTADARAMRLLLPALAEEKLFFLDSLTNPASSAYQLAREMGIRAGRRDIFLDNEQVPEKIISQLELLVRIAERNGRAVAIGHPYPATLEALRRFEKELQRRVEMVPVSRLIL